MTKIAGSGSISQRHGSPDPDPYQNVTDPQRCFAHVILYDFIHLNMNSSKSQIQVLKRINSHPRTQIVTHLAVSADPHHCVLAFVSTIVLVFLAGRRSG
jgi:hypothetical protein